MRISIEADLHALRTAPGGKMLVQLVDEELDYFDEELPVLAAEKLKKQPRKISFLYCFTDGEPANVRVFRLRKGTARRLNAHINNLPGRKATLSVSVHIKNYHGTHTVIPVIDAITLHP